MLTLLEMVLPCWPEIARDKITDAWYDDHPAWEWDAPDPSAAEVVLAVLEELQESRGNWANLTGTRGMTNAQIADFLTRLWMPDLALRLCACGCGRPVTSWRPDARYATGACRVRAHRAGVRPAR